MVNNTYFDIAYDVVDLYNQKNPNDRKQLDPLTIQLIILAVKFVVENCILDKTSISDPGIFNKMWFRWNVRRICAQMGERHRTGEIYDLVLNYGATLTVESLQDLKARLNVE